MSWFVYILECADQTLYTGITNDLDRRIAMHEGGTGAKYTKGRGPFRTIFTQELSDRSAATKRELEIKKLTRKEKYALAKGFIDPT